jgi:GNAT superfamily N-acetyltransferase
VIRSASAPGLELVPLEACHVAAAARLVAARYRDLRRAVPLLPSQYGEPDTIAGLLRRLVPGAPHVAAPGVAALQGDRLAGFLTGFLIPDFRGAPGIYCPEWASAVEPGAGRRIYEEMYTHLAARWVAGGYVQHALGLFSSERTSLDAWHWLGFGMAAADGVRTLDPVDAPTTAVTVRRGTPDDVEGVADLLGGLRRHLAASPTFLVWDDSRTREQARAWLEDPNMALWLAFDGDPEPVSFLVLGPATHTASTIIRDEGTTSIVGAFTRPGARGAGVGAALLDRALAWGREAGYARCAVDFEPMNVLAARFWMRHFQPVVYSVFRHVDPRAVPD